MRVIQLTTIYDPDGGCLVQHALTDDSKVYERNESPETGVWGDWEDVTGNLLGRSET